MEEESTSSVASAPSAAGFPTHFEITPQQDTSKNYTTFTCFLKLPIELRLKIWNECCNQARVVDLRVEFTNEAKSTDTFMAGKRAFKYKSHQGVPAILNVNQEAREVGLAKYSPEFGTSIIASSAEQYISKASSNIYINWELDLICPIQPDHGLLPHKPAENTIDVLLAELAKHNCVRRMAFHHDVPTISHGLTSLMTVMPASPLEEIIVYIVKDTGSYPVRRALGLAHPTTYDPSIAEDILPGKDDERLMRELETVMVRETMRAMDITEDEISSMLSRLYNVRHSAVGGACRRREARAVDVPEWLEKWKAPGIKLMVML